MPSRYPPYMPGLTWRFVVLCSKEDEKQEVGGAACRPQGKNDQKLPGQVTPVGPEGGSGEMVQKESHQEAQGINKGSNWRKFSSNKICRCTVFRLD